jgi:multiple sugar transport system substrate-binding protein
MKFHKPIHGPSGKEVEFLTAAFEDYSFSKVEYVTPDWRTWYEELLETDPNADEFDIIYVPGGWVPTLAKKGILVDLESIAPEFVKRWKENVPYAAYELGNYKGVQYGVPLYGGVWSFMYNKDILQRAGFEQPPTTWDELLSYAKTIQQKQLSRYAYGLNDDSDGHFIDHGYIYLLAGGLSQWKNNDGSIRFEEDGPLKGLSFIQKMIQLGLCNMPVHSSSTQIRDQFFAGELAMTVGPSDWLLHKQVNAPDFPLGVSLVPYPEGGNSTSYSSYGFYCIVKGDKSYTDRIALLDHLLEPSFLDHHLERIGMLPIHNKVSRLVALEAARVANATNPLSVFSTQLYHYSGCLPAMDAGFQSELTSEILSCLRLVKTPMDALNSISRR